MKKILIVDSDPKERLLYAKIFRTEGFKVYEAIDAWEAVEVLLNYCIDLIILNPGPKETDQEFLDLLEIDYAYLKVIIMDTPARDQDAFFRANDYFDRSTGP